ncbi:unnamed protein product [Prunus brigantina]
MTMAKLMLLLVALIFSYGVISTEERSLKREEAYVNSEPIKPPRKINSPPNHIGNVVVNLGNEPAPPRLVHSIKEEEDAFRPTSPGHIPGVGN